MKKIMAFGVSLMVLTAQFCGGEQKMSDTQDIVYASQMSISENGLSLIKEFEGFLQYAQWDYSQWSIGYGTGVDKDAYPDGITEAEADRLLRNVVIRYEGYVNSFISKYNIQITQNQYDALVSFTYNLGNVWSYDSQVTIRDYLINGISNYSAEEIKDAFGLWCKAGGQVLDGLVRRRAREAELFLSDHDYNKDSKTMEKWRITSATGVRLRSGSSTSAEIIDVLPYKYVAAVTEKIENEGFLWGKTIYNGKSGWTVLDYAEHLSGEVAVDEKTNDDIQEKWRITSYNGVNLRLKPGLSAEKTGLLNYNDIIMVYEKDEADGYTWGRTNYNNKPGWCVLDYAEQVFPENIARGKLMGIRVQTLPDKLVYMSGELFDDSGMTVVAVYSDGTEEYVNDYGCSGNTVTPGHNIIRIDYQSVSCEFTVRVNCASGDVDENGVTDFRDYSEIKKYMLKKSEQIDNADTNSDDKVNVLDLIRLKQKVFNYESEQRYK